MTHYGCDEKHCELVIELNSKYNEFTKQYTKDIDEFKKWRNEIQCSINKIETKLNLMYMPFRITVWIFMVLGGGLLVEIGKNIFFWLNGRK